MEMRLIDADTLIEAIRHDADQATDSNWGYGLNHAVAIVRSQPTVDAVPVVRCSECKYDPRNNSSPEELPYWFPCKNGMRDQDWFCADGKKDGCQAKRPKETFWDSLSEADLMEPMRHFKD